MAGELSWVPGVLRAAGVRVMEHPGWRSRVNPGVFTPTDVVWHHDASPKGDSPGVAAFLVRQLEAGKPSAQLWLDRAGVWHVIGGGKAYHTGDVRAGAPGNASAIGVETDHTVGEVWPAAQLQSLRVGTAALLRHMKRGPGSLHFHSSICSPPGRKLDPAGLTLLAERTAVGRLIAGPRTPDRRSVLLAGAGVPGKAHRQNRDVQGVLAKAGFFQGGERSDTFGPRSQRAVVLFHRKYPRFKSVSRRLTGRDDPALGVKGWEFLQLLVGRR